jgi:hypothetical protein
VRAAAFVGCARSCLVREACKEQVRICVATSGVISPNPLLRPDHQRATRATAVESFWGVIGVALNFKQRSQGKT